MGWVSKRIVKKKLDKNSSSAEAISLIKKDKG